MCFMKKLLVLFLTFLIFFSVCGCKEHKTTPDDTSSQIKIVLPKDDTVNGYRQEGVSSLLNSTDSSDNLENGNYYVNSKTKKFHKSTCYYAKAGSQNGSWSKSSRESLLNEGYSPCSKCSP